MEILDYHPFKSSEAKEKYLNLYDKNAKSWPVSSEVRMINTSYGDIFVRISGPADAPPLVLLHGMGNNSLMWQSNIEALSKDYRTYAVDDTYGNGRSIYTETIKNGDGFVEWFDELFNALKLGEGINIVGMSYGGWQASQYMLKCGYRVNKAVLLAPAATVLPVSSAFTIRTILTLLHIRYFTKSLMHWLMEDLVKKDKKLMRKIINIRFLASKCFKTRRPPVPTVLDDNELQSVKIPVLYVVGKNEKIYSASKAVERINNVAPHIKTEIIPDAGHDLLYVQTEMVNKKVLEFLK